jgi:pimeloyl-ACP methyl ester carboxylesterase
VIYFHGNGELATDSEQYCGDLFTGAGMNVCFAEYRGYGTSDGEPALAGMLGDGERVVAALGEPVERVAAFGRSLGSLYAIELAHRFPQLGGLVLESGIAVLTEIWPFQREAEIIGCTASEIGTAVGALFDHRAKLGGFTGPQLVLHAAGDHLVSVTHGARLHAWGGGRDKRRVFFPRGDHNTIMGTNAVQYAAELQKFLRDSGLASVRPSSSA